MVMCILMIEYCRRQHDVYQSTSRNREPLAIAGISPKCDAAETRQEMIHSLMTFLAVCK